MLNSLIDLFFPKICYACGKSIESKVNHICISCRHKLPRIKTHLYEENPIERIFWGRINFKNASSFLRFQKDGKVQNLLHHLKYQGIKEIGITLGEMAALEINKTDFFNEIDILLPVPIHQIKARKRGFNQSHLICEGINKVTKLKIDISSVKKVINTESQTKKGRYKRWENVNSSFSVVSPKAIENKHILIVDDIVTTGSTVEALAIELLKFKNVKLSLLTIASTF